jgi:hypothetical protein
MRSATYSKGFTMADDYDDESMTEDAAFADRIAARLRAPEHAHPTFEQRLMEKVRAEGPLLYPAASSRGWLRGERILRVRPLRALAIAAGISVIIGVSGVAIGLRMSSSPTVASQSPAAVARDTVQIVRFVFVDPGAKSVELVGDFNEWAKGSTVLRRSGAPGVWAATVPLSPGRHEYAFIINGSRWVADPLAPKSSDEFGTESSVIRIGNPSRSAT